MSVQEAQKDLRCIEFAFNTAANKWFNSAHKKWPQVAGGEGGARINRRIFGPRLAEELGKGGGAASVPICTR